MSKILIVSAIFYISLIYAVPILIPSNETSNSTDISSDFVIFKKFTKIPPARPHSRRTRKPPIEEFDNIITIPPLEDLQSKRGESEEYETEDFAQLDRVDRLELGLWKKIKHGLKKVGKGLEKGLKKVGQDLLDGVIGGIASGAAG
uniref:Uncharacterized protein n=1 Tax=Caenorhabditis japonica TaxID=281687 RepID=A0A8R1EJ31_CAEJA